MAADITVIKISGHALDDDAMLRRFAMAVAARNERLVIVHGGGVEITRMQERLRIQPRYVDGLRITNAESLALVEMVLCGSVNKLVVRHLVNAGVDALGMSGVDRGLVRAEKMRHEALDMGFTGAVASVQCEKLRDLLEIGITPVLAPVCFGADSNFNVNADPVTGALAAAISASSVVFISNVPGVLVDGERIARLRRTEARRLIQDGVISGGMIPKVNTALDVLSSGLLEAVITDLEGWARGGGTTLVNERQE